MVDSNSMVMGASNLAAIPSAVLVTCHVETTEALAWSGFVAWMSTVTTSSLPTTTQFDGPSALRPENDQLNCGARSTGWSAFDWASSRRRGAADKQNVEESDTFGPVMTRDPVAIPSGPSRTDKVTRSADGVASAVLSTISRANWLVMFWNSVPSDRVSHSWSSPDCEPGLNCSILN